MSWAEDNGLDTYDPFWNDLEDATVWTTKEGETIEIIDMTDSHLLNAYKFISKKREAEWLDNNMLDVSDDDYSYEFDPWYRKQQTMEAELIKRGLLK